MGDCMQIIASSWRTRVIVHSGKLGWMAILLGIAVLVLMIGMLRRGVSRRKIWMVICLACLPLTFGIGGTGFDLWEAHMWASHQARQPENMEQWFVLARISTAEGALVTGILLAVGIVGLLFTTSDTEQDARSPDVNGVTGQGGCRGRSDAGTVLFLATAFAFLCVFLSPVHAVEWLPEYTSAYWWWELIEQLWNSGINGVMAGGIFVGAVSLGWMVRQDRDNWQLLVAVAVLIMFVGLGLHIVQKRILYVWIIPYDQVDGLLASSDPGYWDALFTRSGVLLLDLIVVQLVLSAILLLEADVRRNVRIVLALLALLVLGLQINNLLTVRWWHYSRACEIGPFNFASCISPMNIYEVLTGTQSLGTVWMLIVAPGFLVLCCISIRRACQQSY